MRTLVLSVEFAQEEQETLKKLGFKRHQVGGWRKGIWELRVYLMGSTRMYSLRHNNKRIYGPVCTLEKALEHWESLIYDPPMAEKSFKQARPVRLF